MLFATERAAARPRTCTRPSILLGAVLAATLLSACGEGSEAFDQTSPDGAYTPFTGRLTQEEILERIRAAPKTETTTFSGEPAYRLPDPELLARFVFPDGREATFHWSPITNDVVFTAMESDDGAPLYNPRRSMLENYIELAGEDAPVPRAIVELDDMLGEEEREQALSTRNIVDRLSEPAHLGRASVAQESALALTSSVTPSCSDAMHFADNHCYYLTNDLVAPNRHDPIWCCDESYPSACGRNPSQGDTMWAKLIRETQQARKNSYSRTAACGASVMVDHYYKAWGEWFLTDVDPLVVPSNTVSSRFRMGGAWWDRKIEHDAGSGGGLRAYSEFTNP
ncbi:hypothetical protein BE04_26570 [Sorangium cellulosum]|uniref:Secreted protein n=1 Tax=Sorangium cellulosum TaxID=56 RepID=A0A150P427_SORCE|nr:hypothetical protein BE04_26570 [Sorangium cellulosum]